MKVGILGTGDVGRALANGFLAKGHDVMMGARSKDNPKLTDWVASAAGTSAGGSAAGGTFDEAARHGDVVVVATLGTACAEVVQAAGPDNLADKVVIDTTNPLDHSKGFPPRLAELPEGSAGEEIQAWAPKAHVVKAFNIVGNPFMVDPDLPGGPPTMFYCGDDDGAKQTVREILESFGWETSDVGGIEMSRHLESMCIVWVAHGAKTGNWANAFKMLTVPQ